MTVSLQHYRNLVISYLLPQRLRIMLLALLLLAGAGLELLNPTILRSFIDQATGAVGVGAAAPQATLNSLMLLAALFIGVAVLTQLAAIAATYLSEQIGWTSTNQLRSDLARHCLRLDLPFHSKRTAGEMIERVDGDVTALAQFFSQFSVQIGGSSLLLFGVLVMLWRESLLVGAVMTVFAISVLLVLLRMRNLAVPSVTADREAQAMLFGTIEERLAGLDDIRANAGGGHVLQRLDSAMREVVRRARRAMLLMTTLWGTTIFLFAIGYALALGLGVYLYLGDMATLGTVYLFFQYTNLLRRPLEGISEQLRVLQQASAGLGRIEELRALHTSIQDGQGLHVPEGALGLTFERVHFSYEQSPTITDLSFELAPGTVLGLLGRTGSGKTTLTRLLLRLYDINGGTIRLNGVDLRELTLAELRRRVGIVTQDVQLFEASIRDNLTLFDGSLSDAQILAALQELELQAWLDRQPAGLDTQIGPGMLSAGEAQLLALARVFLRDPGLIILDEASSRLDPATERMLEQAIDRLLNPSDQHPRTAIIIAHRLQTVQRADNILLLEQGRLLEYGPRAELAADPQSRFAELLRVGLEDMLV